MVPRCSKLALIVVFLPAMIVLAQEPAQRFKVVVDRMVDAMNKQDYPRIRQDFGKVMLDAFPLETLKPFYKNLAAKCGKIDKLGPPRIISPNQAVFPAHFERAVLDIKVVLDNKDKIIGLWFLPHTPAIPVPGKHATVLGLPFDGRWKVAWGGDTRELNQHHHVPNQRYAFDLLVVDDNGKTHKNGGKKNEDYFAFGRKVLAPADGVVTDVIRGVRDNTPRSMNPYSALGNAVFIEHRKHEVSILAHFKQGTIKVKAGDKVTKGQLLGLCGNSGNSSEPHIHYHLQNTPTIQDGTGIKCFFDNMTVTRKGKKQSRKHYSPVKDEIIDPRPNRPTKASTRRPKARR